MPRGVCLLGLLDSLVLKDGQCGSGVRGQEKPSKCWVSSPILVWGWCWKQPWLERSWGWRKMMAGWHCGAWESMVSKESSKPWDMVLKHTSRKTRITVFGFVFGSKLEIKYFIITWNYCSEPHLFVPPKCRKPVSETLVLKQRELHYQGSPKGRQGIILEAVLPCWAQGQLIYAWRRRWICERRVRGFLKPLRGWGLKQPRAVRSPEQGGTCQTRFCQGGQIISRQMLPSSPH